MKFDTWERQPIGAYYTPLLKMCFIIVALSFFMGAASHDFNTFTSFIIILFIFVWGPYAIYRRLRYNNYRYSISQEKITVETGIFSKNTIAVLFNLVQNVNVNEPILLRFFGLAKIQFSTPSDHIEIALSKDDAVSLQNLMTSKMSVNRVGLIDQKIS